MARERLHVVGGGLVGSLTTVILAQRGFPVTLYERLEDMRAHARAGGRSINLAVTSRGLKALTEVGLRDEVLKMAVPMCGRMLHSIGGETKFVPYSRHEQDVIYSVSRADLNRLLLHKAGSFAHVDICFEHRCVGMDLGQSLLRFVTPQGDLSVHADIVLGTDGGGSSLRGSMPPGFDCSEQILEHGYKELVIPSVSGGTYAMEKNALHIWPRKSFMLIALPNLDGSFTVTFFFAHQGSESFASLSTPELVHRFFAREFPDALALMPALVEIFFANPTGFMGTVKCKPWHVGNKLFLLGDAAHAIVPFFGQGMNCGFEDCSTLGGLLDACPGPIDWASLFAKVNAARKPNADAIADMALENFIEMRDTVADPKFQLKSQIGFELEKRYPGKFIPRYGMVVFHPEISYAEARRRGQEQDKILEKLCAGVSRVEDVAWEEADGLMEIASSLHSSQ